MIVLEVLESQLGRCVLGDAIIAADASEFATARNAHGDSDLSVDGSFGLLELGALGLQLKELTNWRFGHLGCERQTEDSNLSLLVRLIFEIF